MNTVQTERPVISVRGGFLRSLENNVAVIRALGFQTQIKIFQLSSGRRWHPPLTILVENVCGTEVRVHQQGGTLDNLIRSNTSVIFDLTGPGFQQVRITYPYQSEEFDFMFWVICMGYLAISNRLSAQQMFWIHCLSCQMAI